ncbi:MAG: DUF2987 domain-containing protein [Gammaproteobacteria bacterium]|nr:DUF2987 domain-containing protein [Gammaproteobacteria bacterium]
MLPTRPRAVLSLMGLLLAGTAQAEIRIDYDDYYERVQDIKEYKALAIQTAIRDEDSGQACAIASVYVKNKQGTELLPQASPLHLALPVKEAWYDKGSKVIVKAPGNCEFTTELVQAALAATELDYRQLFAGLGDFRRLAEANSGLFSSTVIKGLRLGFPTGAKGQLTIHAKAGDKILVAQEGWLEVTEDAALGAENPTVSLSVLPERILPLAE